MAKDMNKWIGTGRLGADPETRKTRDGDPIVNLRIAISNSWKDRDSGEKKENTEWVPVVLFGHSADFADRYAKKGDKVLVEGEFKTRKWSDQDGKDRYTTEIVVQNFGGSFQILASADGAGRRDDRDDRGGGGRDRDDDRGRGRDRNDRGGDRDRDRGRDDDRRQGRGGRDDDRGGRDGGRDQGRDGGRGRDDDARDRGRGDDRGRGSAGRLDDDIPF